MRVQLCCLLLIFAMVPCTAVAAVLEADHQLVIELDTATHSLRGTDRIRLRLQNAVSLNISLAEQARVERLSLNGAPLAFERKAHWITTELPVAARRGGIELELAYHVRYNDPLPDDPPSFDNPGSGVRGVITTHGGVFLMAGSRWHPSLQAGAQHFSVRVRAPQGLYAVTAGRLVSMGDEQGQSVTLWRVERCQEELPLCAGNYTMRQTTVPGSPGARAVAVRTFFTGGDVGLSQRYLDAAARHLAFYGELHGPYAFDGFAVVENFFPTGYGFPSFTLLGGSVLRLPFIPETSLRHEVAHCWWGNGVLVDYSQGNWCEGLTSYVADHQAKEELSQDEAREYRRRILSNYAQLVGDASVMPLKLFVARENPATQAVGYGKAMFVFHMLRKRMGDECFWEGLRDLYARKKFATAAWSDVLDAFVRQGGLDASDAGRFMEEWIDRTEAPRLHLEDVHAQKEQGGWQVSGKICQGGPVFHLRVPVVIETAAGNVENVLELKEACGDMLFHSAAQPVALNVDPGADVFRLLAPGEMPATVNSVKGAPTLAVIMSKGTARVTFGYRAQFAGWNGAGACANSAGRGSFRDRNGGFERQKPAVFRLSRGHGLARFDSRAPFWRAIRAARFSPRERCHGGGRERGGYLVRDAFRWCAPPGECDGRFHDAERRVGHGPGRCCAQNGALRRVWLPGLCGWGQRA